MASFTDDDFVRHAGRLVAKSPRAISILSSTPMRIGSERHRRLAAIPGMPGIVTDGFMRSGRSLVWVPRLAKARVERHGRLMDVPFGKRRRVDEVVVKPKHRGKRSGYVDAEFVFWAPQQTTESASSAIEAPDGIVCDRPIVPISRGDIAPIPRSLFEEFRSKPSVDGQKFLAFDTVHARLSAPKCGSVAPRCIRDPLWRTVFRRYQSSAVAVSMREVRLTVDRPIRDTKTVWLGYLHPATTVFAPKAVKECTRPGFYREGTCLFGTWIEGFAKCAESRPRLAEGILDRDGKCTPESVGACASTLGLFESRILAPLKQASTVFSIAGTPLWSRCEPTRVHNPIKPFYAIVHDNHVFPIVGKPAPKTAWRMSTGSSSPPTVCSDLETVWRCDAETVVWAGSSSLDDVVVHSLANNHIPHVVMHRSRIEGVCIMGKKRVVCASAWDDRIIDYQDAAVQYPVVRDYLAKLASEMMSPDKRSVYSEDLRAFVFGHPRYALFKKMNGTSSETVEGLWGVDIRRCYANIMRAMVHVPVFGLFDVEQPFSGTIDDMTIYRVVASEKARRAYPLFFDAEEIVTFGCNLRDYYGEECRVVGQIRPFDRRPTKFADVLACLESDARLSDAHKKTIPNIVAGLLERRYVEDSEGYVCTDATWAEFLSRSLGDGWRTVSRGGFYVVFKHDRREMHDGFYPIKHMVYDTARNQLQRLAMSIPGVVGVRTDCVYTASKPGRVPVNARLLEPTTVTFPDATDTVVAVPPPLLTPTRTVHRILITGGPGSGKSTMATRLSSASANVFVICPTRALVADWVRRGYEASTVNRFLGFKCEEWDKTHRVRRRFDTLIVDEVFQLRARTLQMLAKLDGVATMIATGDPDQLPPVDVVDGRYRQSAVRTMFPNAVHLETCHRLVTEPDRIWLDDLRTMPDHRSMVAALKARVPEYDARQPTPACVCTFYQSTAAMARSKLEFMPVVGSRWLPRSGGCERTIVSTDSKVVMLDDGSNVDAKFFDKYWMSAVVRTAHSLQGSTVDGVMAICDLESPHITREWVLTAVSRVRRIDDLRVWPICAYPAVCTRLGLKRAAMRSQDAKRGFGDTSHIPSVPELHAILKSTGFACYHCGTPIDDNFEFDRIESVNAYGMPMPHSAENLVASCHFCNIEKK